MDKKKITRRAALGTVAIGVGGLVATPYIIHALKGKSKIPLQGAYEKLWSESLKETQIATEDVKGHDLFSINFAPRAEDSFNYVLLFAAYEKEPDLQKVPYSFGIRKGSFTFKTDQERSIIAEGHNTMEQIVGRHYHEALPTSRWTVPLIKEGQWVQHNPDNMGSDNKQMFAPTILALQIPNNTQFQVGSSWKGPTTFLHVSRATETTYKIIGFANIAGFETVKVRTNTTSASIAPQVSPNTEEIIKGLVESGMARADAVKFAPRLVKASAEVSAEGQMAAQGTAYVDLQTGITVRMEISSVLKLHSNGGKASYAYSIYQLFV
jgi:hypothetical protein